MIEVFKEQLKQYNVPEDAVHKANEKTYNCMEVAYQNYTDSWVMARLLASLHTYVHTFETEALQAFLDEDQPLSLTMTLDGREVKEGDILFCSKAKRLLIVDGLKETGGVVGVTCNEEFFPLCHLEREPSDLLDRLTDLVSDMKYALEEINEISADRDQVQLVNTSLAMISGIRYAKASVENFLHLFKD